MSYDDDEVIAYGKEVEGSYIEVRLCGEKEAVDTAVHNLSLIFNVKRVTQPYQYDEDKGLRLVYLDAKPKKIPMGILKLLK